ncbi:hypothetical protein ACFQQB_21965 [Nonomuraea rubra]|uniref:hypothetical protein n=1 Tax=Nonomuraea rubra TaxID=46180 RepID=UPI0036183670
MRTKLAAVSCLMVTATACATGNATTATQPEAASAPSGSFHGSAGVPGGRDQVGAGVASRAGFEGVGAAGGAGYGGAGAASRAWSAGGSAGDVADPVRLRIPAIRLSTRVIPLRLDAKGHLVAPTRFDRVGWNRSGPEPGEKGSP